MGTAWELDQSMSRFCPICQEAMDDEVCPTDGVPRFQSPVSYA